MFGTDTPPLGGGVSNGGGVTDVTHHSRALCWQAQSAQVAWRQSSSHQERGAWNAQHGCVVYTKGTRR